MKYSLVATKGWHVLRARLLPGYSRTALNQNWNPLLHLPTFTTKGTRYSSEEALLHAVKKRRSSPEQDPNSLQVKRDEVQGVYLELDEEKDKKENKDETSKVEHGSFSIRGKMDHGMEDYIVEEIKIIDGNELGLYAIFDGHAGREVAEYLQSHLFDNILNEPDFWTDPESAIRRAYKATDEEILERVHGGKGGSTAVTAILINKKRLIVANVGDSRAVICKRGVAKQLSVDHEPEKEKDVVESRGGIVVMKPGNVPRVDGQLAMTRAFGDGSLKKHITSEPDITIKTIDPDSEFIILASDGVWKVMSNEEAAACIRGLEDAKEAAKELVNEALYKGSCDDISCVVVMFQ